MKDLIITDVALTPNEFFHVLSALKRHANETIVYKDDMLALIKKFQEAPMRRENKNGFEEGVSYAEKLEHSFVFGEKKE